MALTYTTFRPRLAARTIGALLLAAVLFTGCDSGGNETATFTLDPVTFQFPLFDRGDVQNGAVELASENTESVGPALRNFGFTQDEVVSAQVTGVTLVRRSLGSSATPPPADGGPVETKVFDFINQAEVQLRASGVSAVTVGSRSGDFELSDGTSLDVQGGDVTGLVQANDIEAVLNLTLDSFDGGPFRVEVDVTFEVTGQL